LRVRLLSAPDKPENAEAFAPSDAD
jgi:hypothetical protein